MAEEAPDPAGHRADLRGAHYDFPHAAIEMKGKGNIVPI
jgi:hypothetical protein